MELSKRTFSVLLSVNILMSVLGMISPAGHSTQLVHNSMKYNRIAYDTHDPIYIASDGEFETQAGIEGWQGNGTEENPYIISNINITTDTTCVEIRTTTVHFMFNACLFRSASDGNGIGLDLYNVVNATFTDCRIESMNSPFEMELGKAVEIEDCIISNCTTGMKLYRSHNSSVELCTIDSNSGYGLLLHDSYNITVTSNSFTQGNIVIDANNENQWYHSLFNNSVDNEPIGYFKHQSDTQIDGSLYGELILANCSRMNIEGGVFQNTTTGCLVGYSDMCSFENTQFNGLERGIWFRNSVDCLLESVVAQNSQFGISAKYGSNLTVIGSDFLGCENAIEISFMDNSSVFDCTVTDCTQGIYIHYSHNSTAQNNEISFVTYGGGITFENTDDCKALDNHIWNSAGGIALWDAPIRPIVDNNTLSNNNAGVEMAFTILGVPNCTVTRNVISGGILGISFDGDFAVVEDNTVTDVLYGIDVDGFYAQIINNVVENTTYHGIVAYEMLNEVSKNQIIDCPHSGLRIESEESTVHDNVLIRSGIVAYEGGDFDNNTVNGRPFGYFEEVSDLVIDASEYGQIMVLNCSNIVVQGGTFCQSGSAITVSLTENCTIEDNEVAKCADSGIYVGDSEDIQIIRNTVLDVEDPSKIIYGINVWDVTECLIEYNIVVGNANGIHLHGTTNATIRNCTVIANEGYGISLFACDFTEAYYNEIGWNGINIDEVVSPTIWDDGLSFGNSWSDYNGTGNYTIPGSTGVDRYPSQLFDIRGPFMVVCFDPWNPLVSEPISVGVVACDPSNVSQVILSHSYDEGVTWTNVTMSSESDIWTTVISGFEEEGTVRVKVYTSDTLGFWTESEVFVFGTSVQPTTTTTTTTTSATSSSVTTSSSTYSTSTSTTITVTTTTVLTTPTSSSTATTTTSSETSSIDTSSTTTPSGGSEILVLVLTTVSGVAVVIVIIIFAKRR